MQDIENLRAMFDVRRMGDDIVARMNFGKNMCYTDGHSVPEINAVRMHEVYVGEKSARYKDGKPLYYHLAAVLECYPRVGLCADHDVVAGILECSPCFSSQVYASKKTLLDNQSCFDTLIMVTKWPKDNLVFSTKDYGIDYHIHTVVHVFI